MQTEFEALVASEEMIDGGDAMPFESVVSSTTDGVETTLSKAREYAQRLGTTSSSSPEGHIFINGKYYVIDDVCCHALVLICDTEPCGVRISCINYNQPLDRPSSISKRMFVYVSSRDRLIYHVAV